MDVLYKWWYKIEKLGFLCKIDEIFYTYRCNCSKILHNSQQRASLSYILVCLLHIFLLWIMQLEYTDKSSKYSKNVPFMLHVGKKESKAPMSYICHVLPSQHTKPTKFIIRPLRIILLYIEYMHYSFYMCRFYELQRCEI